MRLQIHSNVDDFCSVARDLYRRDPIAATVELTVLRGKLDDLESAPLLVTVWEDEKPIGAAIRTPPYAMLCAGLPRTQIADVAAELADLGIQLPSVRGPRDTATNFAAAWCAATGTISTVGFKERLYRLKTLCPPADATGHVRPADPNNFDVLIQWLTLFGAEVFGDTPEPTAAARSVQAANDVGDAFLFWVVHNDPVSVAAVRSPVADVSRIGPVYTPTDRRGNGYGSAVTAAAALWAREHGAKDVVLFTDVANPTSNAIYQRIGFEPVNDYARIDFNNPASPVRRQP